MIQLQTKHIIIGVITAFAVIFVAGFIAGRYERDRVSEQIITGLNDGMRIYSYTVGDLQKQAYQKDTIITTLRRAVREGVVAKEELRLLKMRHTSTVTKFESTVEILLDSIKHSGAVAVTPCPPEEDYHPVLYLPLVFGEQNEFLSLKGEFDEDAKLSMDIRVPITVDVITGWDNRMKCYKTVVATDNPYLNIVDIRSVKLDVRKPKKLGLSVMAGYGFAGHTKGIKPMLGIGVTYDLIQF